MRQLAKFLALALVALPALRAGPQLARPDAPAPAPPPGAPDLGPRARLLERSYAYTGLMPPERYPLSPRTREILAALRESGEAVKVRVWFGPPPEELVDRFSTMRERLLVGQLLDALAHRWGGLEVRWLDPGVDWRAAEADAVEQEGTLVLERAGQQVRLYSADMVEVVHLEKRDLRRYFRGEELLGSALERLLLGIRPTVCFSAGLGEASPRDEGGRYLRAGRELRRRGFEVQTVERPFRDGVAEDCSMVLMAGPRAPLTPAEEVGLRAYLGAGRPLYLLLDPDVQAMGLQRVLWPFGLALTPNHLVEPDQAYRRGPDQDLVVPDLNQHYITEPLRQARQVVALEEARGIGYSPFANTRLDVRTLLQASPTAWGASDPAVPGAHAADLHPPVSAAVAVSSELGTNDGLGLRGPAELRLSVAGDSRFASDEGLADSPGNLAFFLATVRWLTREAPRFRAPALPLEALLR